jgi:ribonucleoside-diphosphate reductase alpha chain
MEFRNGNEAEMDGEAGLFAGETPPRAKAKEAGKAPAVAMTQKTDSGSADLVAQLGAEALAGAAKAVASTKDDSKAIAARRFAIVTDAAHDALLTDFGKDTLDDRYLLPAKAIRTSLPASPTPMPMTGPRPAALRLYLQALVHAGDARAVERRHGRGLPISCYLNSVSDSLEGIVSTWNENVWLASRGGGIGTYWGQVRGIGEPVGLNGKTSGIIPFVRVMDSLTLAISQGSLRRGSAACYLDISHPEIEEFLEIRKPSGDFNRKALNLHHGVLLTDDFMEAVAAGDEFQLKSPKDGSVRGTVDARSLFQKLVETRLATGEPYIVFSDTVNRMMPKHHRDLGLKVSTSNLCSEITLPTGRDHLGNDRTAVCCLSSLNLETWDEWNGDERFIEDVMRFLDNVLEDYIERAPDEMGRAKYSAMRERSVGMGVMGFHSFLQQKGIGFESAMAKAWNLKMFKHIAAKADEASLLLAQERGACPDAADMGVMQRFSCKMAIAPTASISIICGGTSACIEPIPANIYTHKTLSGSFVVKNPYLEKLLRRRRRTRPTSGTRSSSTADRSSISISSARGEGCLQDQLRDRPALAARIRRRSHALHRPGAVAKPLHSRRRRQVGPDDAALPGLGEGHQEPLLPALEVGAARGLRRRRGSGQYVRGATDRAGSQQTDYEECLACQ